MKSWTIEYSRVDKADNWLFIKATTEALAIRAFANRHPDKTFVSIKPTFYV